jgi:pimeloyl-ACP methyl ester carboxylesterase
VSALHVERSGSGEPVLFLHGAAGSSATYGWLPDLGRTVVRMDFRGHGRSDRAESYILGDYAEDALSVLRDIAPAPVVGHSLGGVVAWTLAQRFPELVTGIVLEDPPLYMGEPEGHASNGAIPAFRAMREATLRFQAAGADEATVVAALSGLPYGPDPSRRTDEVVAADGTAARAFALLHLDPAVLDPIIDGSALAATDVEAAVTVPALILAAGLAPAFPAEHARRLAGTHPAVEVRRVEGAGHVIHDELAHRDEYVRTLVERL